MNRTFLQTIQKRKTIWIDYVVERNGIVVAIVTEINRGCYERLLKEDERTGLK